MKSNKKTFITKPYLPPLKKFLPLLEKIWESRELTNNGPFHKIFEEDLNISTGCSNSNLVLNGTLGLYTALNSIKKKGEVITTPFTFIATPNAIISSGNIPRFCDIENDSYNLDPKEVEKNITSDTVAILPVHCYGLPCDLDEFSRISKQYKIPLIYDAAHAFGVIHNRKSINTYGDISVSSFHATKVLNTFEGAKDSIKILHLCGS